MDKMTYQTDIVAAQRQSLSVQSNMRGDNFSAICGFTHRATHNLAQPDAKQRTTTRFRIHIMIPSQPLEKAPLFHPARNSLLSAPYYPFEKQPCLSRAAALSVASRRAISHEPQGGLTSGGGSM